MSRIGRQPILIPEKTRVEIDANRVVVKGPKGELNYTLPAFLAARIEAGRLSVLRSINSQPALAQHGLARSLLANMIQGVSEGFEKRLTLVGTGYRASQEGEGIRLRLGFSHPIIFKPPPGVSLKVKEDTIVVASADKQQVGEVAARIRRLQPPEPYKGKGVRFLNEVVRRKPGKAAKVGLATQTAA